MQSLQTATEAGTTTEPVKRRPIREVIEILEQ